MWVVADLDDDYITKMEDVLELYERPYDAQQPVVCLDEKPVTLHADLRSASPAVPGREARRDNEYERRGTANVFCAVEPKAGRHFTFATPDRSALEFAQVAFQMALEYVDVKTIHLVLDNLNIHRCKSLTDLYGAEFGSEIWGRFTVHYTPTHGSWLNQAEIEIGMFTRQCLGCRRIPDLKTLRRESRAWNRRVNRARTKIKWRFDRRTARQKFGYKNQSFKRSKTYFESMDVRLEKRYSSGFNLLFNYTYSKLIQEVRLLNNFDSRPEKTISGDDRPQRVVLSSSYELPFGKGKPLLSSASGLVNHLVSGWVLNGIYTYQRGAPLDWTKINPIFYGGNLNLDPRQVNGPAFDGSLFNQNSTQQLSDNVRTFPSRFGNLRQDGANNIDLSLLKNTAITERIKFQLRFEAFNALNHPEFSAPELSPTSSGFGLINNQPNLARNLQLGARLVW